VLLLPSQKHGILVCLPKSSRPLYPDDYRPLTLMNTDLKLLLRILANRLRAWLTDLLHPSQHCGIQDNNILGAIAAIRETVVQAELTNAPTCVLSLDFKEAFDNIAHSYLYATLETYGFSACFQRRLRQLYENATSSVQINGNVSSPLPMKCSIRQGCPRSTRLFALCLDPFLRMLDSNINGHQSARHTRCMAVLAYADDVTIIPNPRKTCPLCWRPYEPMRLHLARS
jgi:hypothetical protein